MSDPLGDPLPRPYPSPHGTEPPADDEVNLLDGSIEPTDDSPTVISKSPPPDPRIKTEADFSGGLRGRRLAHYELIEPIGVGGMAAVLRARDTQLDRLVALKILPPEMASDPENVRRFHQEARSAARLDHENIARVFFCGEDQRLHFIAFEFVEGDNLRTILERRGRLPVGESLNYMLQVAAGLAHAAGRGVVHRDIKPSNIIITPNGRAKLVDMGLARSLEPQHDMGLTQSGVTLGTFDYISPEQALEPRDADVRSDIYSLGCTFYHMLTGHPPVPEGTAAKKLHHHQHVKPPDPRQFVPDLPDEVAIILDRMMAKQPRERYQTPEHLVHHLYLAARKLGAAAEVPEGVLAVEAALPSPPTSRPLLFAALAAVAVIGLIFFLDQSPPPPADTAPPTAATIAQENAAKKKTENPPQPPPQPLQKQGSKEDVPAVPSARQEAVVFDRANPTVADLEDWLKQNSSAEKIVLKLDDLDASVREERQADLVIANPSVVIQPRTPGKRPSVRDSYHHQIARDMQATFTIRSKTCTIEGIRFVLNQAGAGVPMTALRFDGTRQVKIRNCEFFQAGAFGSNARLTSVFAETKEPATLSLSESCFLGFADLTGRRDGLPERIFSGSTAGGQDAVTRHGPVAIQASNCLFGPHAAAFRLEGTASEEEGRVRLEHTSMLLGPRSTVFDVVEGTNARIQSMYSLFSRPGEPDLTERSEGQGAVLLRQGSRQDNVPFEGRQNRYHQIDRYLLIRDGRDSASDLIAELKANDDGSRELLGDPWNEPQPLVRLDALSLADAETAIEAAFHVNFRLPALRLKDREGKLIGAEEALAFSYVDRLTRPSELAAMEGGRRQLVVARVEKPDHDALIYPKLSYALLDAQRGDVIRLRLDDEIKLDPLVLSDPRLADLTIRADRGFHPTLTLNDTQEVNTTALFDIYNGRLRLENVELRLRPRGEDSEPLSILCFLGDGECILKDCLITLERTGRKTALAQLPEKRMKKSSQTPRLTLLNCFVRGQGNLVCSQGGPFAEVTLRNSLIALTGSLLNVESDKESERETEGGAFVLHLRKCTTYLGENLIRLRAAKDLRSVPRVQCEAEDCLFLPAGSDRTLVHLEGPESEERGLMDKLSWRRGKNAYGLFASLLEQQSVGVMPKMPSPSPLDNWKKNVSGESDSDYNVKLTTPPTLDTPLGQLLPSAFRTTERGLKDYGADVVALGSLPVLRGGKNEESELDFDLPDFDSD